MLRAYISPCVALAYPGCKIQLTLMIVHLFYLVKIPH